MARSSEECDPRFSRRDSQQSLKGRDSDDKKDYQNDWAVPDFLDASSDRANDATYGVSVRRATTSFDPLKVLEKQSCCIGVLLDPMKVFPSV
jgi:hypothetical protein